MYYSIHIKSRTKRVKLKNIYIQTHKKKTTLHILHDIYNTDEKKSQKIISYGYKGIALCMYVCMYVCKQIIEFIVNSVIEYRLPLISHIYYTVNPLYTDTRYNDRIRYDDNLTVTKPSLKM